MTRTSLHALLILFCCTLIACEESVDAVGLPYVERLVVQATLSPGDAVDSIIITRTLPLSGRYDSTKAVLNDVVGRIEVDGLSYPLVYREHSRYEAPGLIAASGKHYRLTAEWHGKQINATTVVPFPPVIDTVIAQKVNSDFPDDALYDPIIGIVRPRSNEAYCMEVYNRYSTERYYQSVTYEYDEDLVGKSDDTLSDGTLHLLYDRYPVSLTPNLAKAVIYAFDEPFYDFYYSFYHNDNGGEILGSGKPITWNVEGDGIGLFLGKAGRDWIIR